MSDDSDPEMSTSSSSSSDSSSDNEAVAVVAEVVEEKEKENDEECPARGVKRTISEVYQPAEPWTCVSCHETYPPDQTAYTAVYKCVHTMCVTCFEAEYNRDHLKCDLCGKFWEINWVPVIHDQDEHEKFPSTIMLPLYGTRFPSKTHKCYEFASGGYMTDRGTIHRTESPVRETIHQHFPWIIKRRLPDKIFKSLCKSNAPHRLEMFPLSEEEYVILTFFKAPVDKINVTRPNYNAVYIHVLKPREYLRITRGGSIGVSEKMTLKNKPLSMRAVCAVSEVIAKNNFKFD